MQAFQQSLRRGRLAHHAQRTCLEHAQRFSLAEVLAPNDGSDFMLYEAQALQEIHYGVNAKVLIEDEDVRGVLPDHLDAT